MEKCPSRDLERRIRPGSGRLQRPGHFTSFILEVIHAPAPLFVRRLARYFFLSSTVVVVASLALTVTGISTGPVNSCQATSV